MNKMNFPDHTAIVVGIDKLIRKSDKWALTERMSSRMVQCASVLDSDGFIGWQMYTPVKGLVRMSLFGTEDFSRDDLEWILEKTGKIAKRTNFAEEEGTLNELYEIYLPVAENDAYTLPIGFGSDSSANASDSFARLPSYSALQFEELVRGLQQSGAILRAVVGPASEEAQAQCRKSVLRSFNSDKISVHDYIGRPVRMRVLMRLSTSPSVRLTTVIQQSVPGAKIRYVGSMDSVEAGKMWRAPLEGARVLPDYAARILMMEPEVHAAATGIVICEESAKKIPASHKNAKDKNAVIIGRAIDATGKRRNITIGEKDLTRHYQIIGQTGTGKSTLLTRLILSAIESGHGLTFFDPHGSTIDVVLRSLPEEYAGKVRVVRIGDAKNPVPLNLWDSGHPASEEKNISDLCELFSDIFDPRNEGFVGPRWERWFTVFAKASIAFLGRRASLESITVISQSQDNMLKLSRAIFSRYPELVETIKEEYGKDTSTDFHELLNWCLSKFQRIISVEQLRKTLGAGTNALDFNHTIDTDTVTLIDLASPIIGTQAARIIGTLLLMKLWNAAMARQKRDQIHLVVVDEAALFQTNPMPRMLAEARKFGISMVLCHQHAGQLTTAVRDALEANSANLSAFRLSPRDAMVAAVRFNDPEMEVSLARLDAFNAITTLSVDGKQTAPFTLEIERPKPQKNGEEIARRIEAQSIETLVKPYRKQRALTSSEIQYLLDHPEKVRGWYPGKLDEMTRRAKVLKGA